MFSRRLLKSFKISQEQGQQNAKDAEVLISEGLGELGLQKMKDCEGPVLQKGRELRLQKTVHTHAYTHCWKSSSMPVRITSSNWAARKQPRAVTLSTEGRWYSNACNC
jgi:hypothetical protein